MDVADALGIKEMAESVLLEKAKDFAVDIVTLCKEIKIALKECYESEYWLELLYESGYLEQKAFESIYQDCKELLRLLIAITKTQKQEN